MIYLDHHATTPVDPRVLERMLPYFTEKFGNPASRTYRAGWEAQDAVETSRKQVASLMGAAAREIVFTSGATEAAHLAIAGVAAVTPPDKRHVVTVATEHKAVLDPCRQLAADGWTVTELRVAPTGLVDLDAVDEAITPQTALVSVMLANNEIGVLQPLGEIVRVAAARGALVHTDAVQALGKIDMDVRALGVDLASVSAHKLYGPKGVGALFVKRGVEKRVRAQIPGGGHERGLRGGTANVPGIVGFGAACEIAGHEMAAEASRVGQLRDRLWQALQHQVGGVCLNGAAAPRLAGNLNVSVDQVEGESLLLALSGVAVSSGAACSSGEPSHVLMALGRDRARALASLRFGLGRWTTADEIDQAAAHVAAAVSHLRRSAPGRHEARMVASR